MSGEYDFLFISGGLHKVQVPSGHHRHSVKASMHRNGVAINSLSLYNSNVWKQILYLQKNSNNPKCDGRDGQSS